jgi:hypothetical protein
MIINPNAPPSAHRGYSMSTIDHPFLAIDPGRNAGWASFDVAGHMIACGLSHPPFTSIPLTTVVRLPGPIWIPDAPWPLVVAEKPHGGRGVASKLDVVTLGRRLQMILDLLRPRKIVELAPSRWKKSLRKQTMIRRIYDEWMTPEERAVLDSIRAAKNHNVKDAIGLGIYYAASQGLREIR